MATSKQKRKFSQDFSGESKTQQHFGPLADINNIVAGYQPGIGLLAEPQPQQNFGDASSKSYEQSMREVAEINSAFAELPSQTRSEFANDPSAWLDHLTLPTPPVDIVDSPTASEDLSAVPPDTTPGELGE